MNSQKHPIIYFMLGLCLLTTCYSIFFNQYRHSPLYTVYFSLPLLVAWITAQYYPQQTLRKAMQYTIFLLCIVSPLLGEGLVCILFIGPIALGLVVFFVLIIQAIQKFVKASKGGEASVKNKTLKSISLLPVLFLAYHFEQNFKPNPEEKIIYDRMLIDAPISNVWKNLHELKMEINLKEDWVFALGIPKPQRIEVEGQGRGALRRVYFANGVVLAKVMDEVEGKSMRIALSFEKPGEEFFNRWIVMKEMELDLKMVNETQTEITHKVYYQRLLPMEWYFGRLERWSAHHIQQLMLKQFKIFVEEKSV